MKEDVIKLSFFFFFLLELDFLLSKVEGWTTTVAFPTCQLKFGCEHKIQAIFIYTAVKTLKYQKALHIP